MKQFNVYCETAGGRFLDECTIEADTLENAYEIVYERYNWQPVHVEIEEAEPSTMLQDTYFGGVDPLAAFPSIFGGNLK